MTFSMLATESKDNRFASPPAGPVEVFPRAEYSEGRGPRDFTAGVRLHEPQPAR